MNILSSKYGSNSREFSKLSEGRILIFSLILVLLLGIPSISSGTEDWQKEYDQLKAKIEREELEPRASPKDINEYRKWIRIKAADRNKATELAGKTQLSGNPYWQNKFLDLKELAQDSGNTTLWTGGYVFMRVKTKGASGGADSWKSAVFKAGPEVGQKLFRWAEEFGFDREIIRDYARCLMRFANGDVEEGYTGLYKGRRSEFGHIDQEGNLVMPNRDFDVNCERRDEFTTLDEGEPIQPADIAMEMVDEIREQCKWYKLQGEYDDSTDLMEEYLQEKKVLCDLPKDKGHYFFLKLAEKYELPEAEEHIDGFYATIKGKVEVLTDDGKEPAPEAKVRVYAPLDDQEWTTTADEDGEYEIEGVLLHKDCSPFEISAEFLGDKEETEFDGPLEEPDRSFEFEKDLLIEPSGWEGTIASTYGLSAKGDEALLTAIAPKSQYQGITNWKLDVVFKLDRGNERIRIYELKSAKFNFSSTSEREWTMEAKEGKMQTGGNWAAEEGRELGLSECDLELIIDLKKKTYKIEGLLHVKNIKEKVEGEFDLDVPPIHGGQKESDEQTMEHREEILIEGEFSGDSPKKLEGNLDEIQELPPEFVEFMEGMAGKIKGTIRWKLEQKGKH